MMWPATYREVTCVTLDRVVQELPLFYRIVNETVAHSASYLLCTGCKGIWSVVVVNIMYDLEISSVTTKPDLKTLHSAGDNIEHSPRNKLDYVTR